MIGATGIDTTTTTTQIEVSMNAGDPVPTRRVGGSTNTDPGAAGAVRVTQRGVFVLAATARSTAITTTTMIMIVPKVSDPTLERNHVGGTMRTASTSNRHWAVPQHITSDPRNAGTSGVETSRDPSRASCDART